MQVYIGISLEPLGVYEVVSGYYWYVVYICVYRIKALKEIPGLLQNQIGSFCYS